MDTKLIFLDIDGTLLRPGQFSASPAVTAALQRAQAGGHKVFLCTGRNLKMTRALLQQYPYNGYVCSAGGLVVCGDTVLYDHPMPDALRAQVMQVFGSCGLFYSLEARDMTYSTPEMQRRFSAIQAAAGQGAALDSEAERWRKAFADGMGVTPLARYNGEPVYKVSFFANSQQAVQQAEAQLGGQFNFIVQDMFGNDGLVHGEIINRAFNKGQAMGRICAALGADIQNTIAFGDSDNDLEMIRAAGLGVAMAGGSARLQASAGMVCPPVEQDGVAQALAELGIA